jgi:hypothetical protein
MKTSSFSGLVNIGILSLMFTASLLWAQSGRRLHYSTLFNPLTVDTVSGEVIRVEHAFSDRGEDYCVHALLKTPQGSVTAILGPKGYMENQGLGIAPNDQIALTGSFISVINKPFLLVMEVTGDRSMKLREANGRPAWAEEADWRLHRGTMRPAFP